MKYEYDSYNKKLRLDRILDSSMFYPGNYGFIEKTLAEDNDELDALIPVCYGILPGTIVQCKIIGALIMSDEKGLDEKIIALPVDSVDKTGKNINDIGDLNENIKNQIQHFFENYKNIDKTKWSKVDKFINKQEAINLVVKYRNKYKS